MAAVYTALWSFRCSARVEHHDEPWLSTGQARRCDRCATRPAPQAQQVRAPLRTARLLETRRTLRETPHLGPRSHVENKLNRCPRLDTIKNPLACRRETHFVPRRFTPAPSNGCSLSTTLPRTRRSSFSRTTHAAVGSRAPVKADPRHDAIFRGSAALSLRATPQPSPSPAQRRAPPNSTLHVTWMAWPARPRSNPAPAHERRSVGSSLRAQSPPTARPLPPAPRARTTPTGSTALPRASPQASALPTARFERAESRRPV